VCIRGDCRVVVAHDDVREQGHDNGRVTSQTPSVCRGVYSRVSVELSWLPMTNANEAVTTAERHLAGPSS